MYDAEVIGDYVIFLAAAFLLNFVWEAWHAVWLYEGFERVPGRHVKTLRRFVRMMTRAALTDAVILTVILLGGAAIWRSWQWYSAMGTGKYLYFLGAALAWAAAIEYKAVFLLQQWAYHKTMPKIFGLGLSPLVQLAITGILALQLL